MLIPTLDLPYINPKGTLHLLKRSRKYSSSTSGAAHLRTQKGTIILTTTARPAKGELPHGQFPALVAEEAGALQEHSSGTESSPNVLSG